MTTHLYGLVNIPVEFTVRDAEAYTSPVEQLLKSAPSNKALASGCSTSIRSKKVYVALTTDDPSLAQLQAHILGMPIK